MEEPLEEQKKTQPTRMLIFSILIMLVVLFFLSREMEAVKTFIRGSGYFGLAATVIIYGALGASLVPSEPLTVLIATIYGPLIATIVAAVGNVLAAVVEYYIGAQLGDVTGFAEKKQNLPWGIGKLPIDSPLFLLGGRMAPGYGPKLVGILSGIYRVSIFKFIWTAAIPNIFGAAIFAYGGFSLFAWIKTIIH